MSPNSAAGSAGCPEAEVVEPGGVAPRAAVRKAVVTIVITILTFRNSDHYYLLTFLHDLTRVSGDWVGIF